MEQQMNSRWASQAGLTFMDRLVLVGVLVAGGIWVLAHFGGPLWDYRTMKELARTVVTEYKDLDEAEVTRRVEYELGRNQIKNDDGKFFFERNDKGGYRVVVEVHIPLSITVADYTIAEDKEWVLYHEVGK